MSTRPKSKRRAQAELEASEIIERLKRAIGVQTDADLAALLDVTRTTLSNWRSRNSVPLARLRPVCKRLGVPLDYLVTGRLGPDRNIATPLDSELLGYVFRLLARYGFIELPKSSEAGYDPARRAAAEFVMLQEQTRELMEQMTADRRMTTAEAKRLVLAKLAKGEGPQ